MNKEQIDQFFKSLREAALSQVALEDPKFLALLSAETYYSIRAETIGIDRAPEEIQEAMLARKEYKLYCRILGPKISKKMTEISTQLLQGGKIERG